MEAAKRERRHVADVAKEVLTKMRDARVSVTPQNYHVWFEHLTGENIDLSVAVNSVITRGEAFTDALNEELYNRYIGTEHQKILLQKLQRQTKEMLQSVLREVSSVSENAGDYSAKLDIYADNLIQIDNLDEIQAVIKRIVMDTQTMSSSSQVLHAQLEETTRRVRTLENRLEAAEWNAVRDDLTGLRNRRGAEVDLADALSEWEDSEEFFSIILCDIDHFKKFNDNYGHLIGDAVLRVTGVALTDGIKGQDTACRWGGEEFLLVLPATSCNNARHVADGLRRRISIRKLKLAETDTPLPPITMSFGVAEVRKGDTIESLIERADKALYMAKQTGRNRVCAESDVEQAKSKAAS